MYNPGIKNSEIRDNHIVCKGKLIFLTKKSPAYEEGVIYREVDFHENIFLSPTKNGCEGVHYNSSFESVKPVIVSETEKIGVGDFYLTSGNKIIEIKSKDRFGLFYLKNGKVGETYVNDWYDKILALPEHFSEEQLQDIVEGELKDGDEIYLKVKTDLEQYYENGIGGEPKIHLNNQNHITLFPIKQMSLDEKIDEIINNFVGQYQRNMFEPTTFKPLMTKALKEMVSWVKNT